MDPSAAATPAPEPLWLRLLRSAVVIGLTLSLTVITALLVIGLLPAVRAAFEPVFSFESKIPKIAIGLTLLFVVFLPLALLAVAARKRWLTWPVLGLGCALVLPVLTWLAWDEPGVRHLLPIEEFSPAFPGAGQSYAVLMQYSKQAPSQEARDFGTVKMAVQWTGASTREPARWREFVTKNRAGLEADWATLAPQRRWLDQLNAFERFGDLTPTSPSANIISFQVWRTLSQRACGFATLQALDGRGDDAIATLLPMLEAGIKLQPSSRTLVRSMVGVVVERMCLETCGIVLDLAPVSAATSARLRAALGPDNAAALARRLILIEYAQFAPVLSTMKLGDQATYQGERLPFLRRPLNLLSGLLLNPNATTNRYGQHIFELAALAEARELGRFTVQSQGFENALWHKSGPKNLGGRLMLNLAVPAYQKVVESHWATADLRTGLRQRLAP